MLAEMLGQVLMACDEASTPLICAVCIVGQNNHRDTRNLDLSGPRRLKVTICREQYNLLGSAVRDDFRVRNTLPHSIPFGVGNHLVAVSA